MQVCYGEAASNLVSKASDKISDKAAKEGKIWVEAYTKDDGTKVKGFWRQMADTVFGNKTGVDAIKEGLGSKQGFAPSNA